MTSTTSLRQTLALADKCWSHARGCEKSPTDCKHCLGNIAWFESLSLTILARVLEDIPITHTRQ